jgi:hypothetical protein
MRRLRDNATAIACAALGAGTLAWLSLYGFAWNDYDLEASAAVKALVAGHLGAFARMAPAYGGSILLRAPFAFAPRLWGGGELAVYRALAVPCLLAAVALAVWLVAGMRAAHRSRLARAAVLGLCVANPVAYRALEAGHAEELLAAVLCVAAVLAGQGRRPTWAGVLLGLAIATKTWALVAAPAVVVALDARRVRALVAAAAIALAVLAPLAAAGGGVTRASGGITAVDPIFQPWQPWWWLGSHGKVVRGSDGLPKPGYRSAPGWIPSLAHLLIVLLAVPLAAAWRRRRGPPGDALLLLALTLLARSVLDPWNTIYYSLPFLLALLAWEARERDLPVATLAASAATWVLFQELPRRIGADAQSAVYLACATPAVAALAARLYRPKARASGARRAGGSPGPA